MKGPKIITVTGSAGGAATSPAYPLNPREGNFKISLAYVPGASGLVDAQHTFDDILTDGTAAAVWFNHETITSISTSADGNIAFPATAVRLNVRGGASGDHKLYIIQSGY